MNVCDKSDSNQMNGYTNDYADDSEATATTDENKKHDLANNTSCNSSNVNVEDIDKETDMKLRGDAIGDTMYSQSFVTKTLLQLNNLKWGKHLEEDLCFLWDMTLEDCVCEYLFGLKYPSIACTVILNNPDENRLIEILIGILANMYCSKCKKEMETEDVQTISSVFATDDPLILIQIVRFFKSFCYKLDDYNIINSDVVEKFTYIFSNSLNKELLKLSLSFIADFTSEETGTVTLDLFLSSFTAYEVLYPVSDELELETEEMLLVLKDLFKIIVNMCDFIENLKSTTNFMENINCNRFIQTLFNKIINYYSIEDNLNPCPDELPYFYYAFYCVIRDNLYYYNKDALFSNLKLISIVDEKEDVKEDYEYLYWPICQIIQMVPTDQLKNDLSGCKSLKVLDCLIKVKNKRIEGFEHKYLDELIDLLLKR